MDANPLRVQESVKPLMDQRLSPRDDPYPEPHQQHLGETRPRIRPTVKSRDETGNGDVEKTGRSQRECIRQGFLGLTQAEIRQDTAQHRCQAGRHVQQERPPARHAGVQKNCEVADPMRNLMRRNGQRRHQPQRHIGQKRRRDEDAIEGVMDAVPDENKHPSRAAMIMLRMVVSVAMAMAMVMVMVIMPVVAVANRVVVPRLAPPGDLTCMAAATERVTRMRRRTMPRVLRRILGLLGMGVPPQHELLDDEEHPEPHHQRRPN